MVTAEVTSSLLDELLDISQRLLSVWMLSAVDRVNTESFWISSLRTVGSIKLNSALSSTFALTVVAGV